MIGITEKVLSEIAGGRIVSDDQSKQVSMISIDSRTLNSGEWYVSLRGQNFDGHNFIEESVKKGAAGGIIEESREEEYKNLLESYITVEDTTKALGLIAHGIRKRSNIRTICITGTNGKTTVKDILHAILSVKFRVLKSEKSYNNIIGLSLSLFRLIAGDEVAVLEIGMNQPGEISQLTSIAEPDIALINNIGLGHLEKLSDLENVYKEKVSILDSIKENGLGIINGDDEKLSELLGRDNNIISFGSDKRNKYQVSSIVTKADGYDFIVNGDSYHSCMKGVHNVYNALAAIAVARELGMESASIQRGLNNALLPPMRLEESEFEGRIFINDAYNSNPLSFEKALVFLSENSCIAPKVVVSGDMLELGQNSKALHEGIGCRIAEEKIDFLIALGKFSGDTASGAISNGMNREKIFCVQDHAEAADILRKITEIGSRILIKGSRIMKMEDVIKCFTISYTH